MATLTQDRAPIQRKQGPDTTLLVLTLILVGFGVAMVYNASYPLAQTLGLGPTYFFKRQAVAALLGLVAMFVASRVPLHWWRAAAMPSVVICSLLLIAVFAFGSDAQGAQRWIIIGPLRIQPSEIAKMSLVVYLASILAANPHLTSRFWTGIVPILGICLFPIFLVEREPDLGTAIVMLLAVLLMFFLGGAKKRWMIALLLFFFSCGLVLALYKGSNHKETGLWGTDSYRWKRLTTFVNPDADPQNTGYQVTRSKVALGTGGWLGVGLGESREKQRGNLPAQRTDFIFAIIGEELGLAGTVTILVLFLWLVLQGFHIANKVKDPFASLLAAGITGLIAIQTIINVGVVTASLPTTGVPLPFISFGGTSLVVTLFSMGILLKISELRDAHRLRREGAGER